MSVAAILVFAPQTAEARHKAPAAGDPQTAEWSRQSRSAEALPQAAGQTAVAELLDMELIELLLQKIQRKGRAGAPRQVGRRTGMPRADLQRALFAPAPASRTAGR